MSNNTIFLIGGGTGGHLFPAVSLGEDLASKGYNVHLITDTRCEKYLSEVKLKTHILSLGSMRSGIISKILMLFNMIFALCRSISLFIVYKPKLVVGFGGYTSFPTLFAAKMLGVSIILHEQNCFIGKVNRYFARYAKKVALNFAETTGANAIAKDKIIIAGNPVRKAFYKAKVSRNFNHKDLTIFVVGGSQGAKIFSSIVPEALQIVKEKLPNLTINIIQQTSALDQNDLKLVYGKICKKIELSEFFTDVSSKYLASDLVIARSGASTIAELIHLHQPAIFVPYPFAAEDHQLYNAKVLCEKAGCWYFEQKSLDSTALASKIVEIALNRNILKSVSEKLSAMEIDSVRILSDTVSKIIHLKV
ncbi:MAG: undecaprenyldiphospho-muramoylpentapeptide beta-N-acetylglucosaminyltransferase [Rickettsiaceae bacterium]|nr:undecaprenyldiphospho-muramoylpentapeptide beta-N-acetylglucosaminyltransferase [Rickettsiaceae bacterium]